MNVYFNNLIDANTGKMLFVSVELDPEYVSERLEEVRRIASESGKRFKKAMTEGKTVAEEEKQL